MNQQNALFFPPPFFLGLFIGLVTGIWMGVPLQLFLSSRSSMEDQSSFGIFPLVRTERGLITLIPSHPILTADAQVSRSVRSISSRGEPALRR